MNQVANLSQFLPFPGHVLAGCPLKHGKNEDTSLAEFLSVVGVHDNLNCPVGAKINQVHCSWFMSHEHRETSSER